MAQRRITLKDIAASLGVSANTVSRALAGRSDISVATQERVRKEASRLGYVPNSIARSLVSGASGTMGIVITNPSNPLYAQLIAGAAEAARAASKTLLLFVSSEDAETEREGIESLLASSVDAVIAVPVQIQPEPWQRVTDLGVPLVLVNRDIPELGVDFVGVDHFGSMRFMVEHVVQQGAQSVWVVEEDLAVPSVESRIAGFEQGVVDAGIEMNSGKKIRIPTRRVHSLAQPWQAEESYAMGMEIFAEETPPDALICGNDFFALGLIKALQEHGYRVPEDVLVTGVGDHPYSNFVSPAITSVRLPGFKLGSEAMRLALSRLSNADQARQRHIIDTEHMIRTSSVHRSD